MMKKSARTFGFAVIFLAAGTPPSAAAAPTTSDMPILHRVLVDTETGIVTYPLIPHRAHLDRRRRELHDQQQYDGTAAGFEIDTSLPPRPHASRHSQTPNNEAIVSATISLRGGDRDAERSLQQQMGALYQGYGTHYVDLWVGSPTPQRQTVIVDTGSGVTAFPCEGCKGCGDTYHTDNYYKHSQSKTFRPLECNECFRGYCATMDGKKKCRISMSYAEGSSWSAYEASDLCYAGGQHDEALTISGPQTNVNTQNLLVDHIDPVEASMFAFELAFGCQISITGLFITQLADGIMGMENEKTSFWKQMHLKNAIPRPEFSLCFSRSNSADREGTGAGAMTLGGVDPRLHVSPMVFAKNMKATGFYAVHLKAVYLREGGGASAQTVQADMGRFHKLGVSEKDLNSGNVIVDSGTTDTYFTSKLNGPFKKAWKELTGKDYSHNSVQLSEEEIENLPTIILVVQGFDGDAVGDEPDGNPDDIAGYAGKTDLSDNPRDVVIAIPATHYMEFDTDTGKYVPRFYTEESSGSVLGANAMMGHDVFFDVARGRIGFSESDCDYVSLLLSEGKSISNVSTKAEVMEEQEEEEYEEDKTVEINGTERESPSEESSVEPPGPDQSENDETPYELFDNKKPSQGKKSGGFGGMAAEIFDDMKHECSSTGCRGIAAIFILGAAAVVIAGIRKALARRRVMRQYQEAELEISDLALDSDSDDDEGGYVDEPPMPQIT